MLFKKNHSLKQENTFGIDISADFYARIDTVDQLHQVMNDPVFLNEQVLFLGGGSNVLFTEPFHGLILKNSIPGMDVIEESTSEIIIRAGGGVNWDDLVAYCVNHNWGGIENLSLIPGSAGAAPIQNIGAYGVELKDAFHSLKAVDLRDGNLITFSTEDCQFGYRDSYFKRLEKKNLIITHLYLRLNKKPQLKLDYGQIRNVLGEKKITKPGIQDVRTAVKEIRTSKLPDPSKIGNAGSFFKNPVIPHDIYLSLKNLYPDIPGFNIPENHTKVPAAWLIEKCGFKGYRKDNAGVHKHHALILVNYGEASGHDIMKLAQKIQEAVHEKFRIQLEAEVTVIGGSGLSE